MAVVVKHPLVQHDLGLLRARPQNPNFRLLVRNLCRYLTYEATKDMSLEACTVEGFSGTVPVQRLQGKSPTVVPILRAGLGMLEGFLEIFPQAPVSMVGLYRDEDTLEPVAYYHKLVDDIHTRHAFILDPMLATGGSVVAAIDLLKKAGCVHIHGLFLVASSAGVRAVEDKHPDVPLYTCTIDATLNEQGYIIPGLGDAGDLIFTT